MNPAEGRSAEALGAFAKALREHGGDPSQIEAIAMDMSSAYFDTHLTSAAIEAVNGIIQLAKRMARGIQKGLGIGSPKMSSAEGAADWTGCTTRL